MIKNIQCLINCKNENIFFNDNGLFQLINVTISNIANQSDSFLIINLQSIHEIIISFPLKNEIERAKLFGKLSLLIISRFNLNSIRSNKVLTNFLQSDYFTNIYSLNQNNKIIMERNSIFIISLFHFYNKIIVYFESDSNLNTTSDFEIILQSCMILLQQHR